MKRKVYFSSFFSISSNTWIEFILDDKLSLKIRPAQYVSHGKPEDITLQYYVHAQVQETDQVFTRLNNIVFLQHDLVKLVEYYLRYGSTENLHMTCLDIERRCR